MKAEILNVDLNSQQLFSTNELYDETSNFATSNSRMFLHSLVDVADHSCHQMKLISSHLMEKKLYILDEIEVEIRKLWYDK